ncbi:MAG: hypothetical protein AB1649_23180 [Chloroflexota bacterium]
MSQNDSLVFGGVSTEITEKMSFWSFFSLARWARTGKGLCALCGKAAPLNPKEPPKQIGGKQVLYFSKLFCIQNARGMVFLALQDYHLPRDEIEFLAQISALCFSLPGMDCVSAFGGPCPG